MDQEPTVYNTVSFAWKKTKSLLFPFELKRWLKILMIVWLAGHAAGLGGNFNAPRKPKPSSETVREVQPVQNPPKTFQELQEAIKQADRRAGPSSLGATTSTPAQTQALENIPPEVRVWLPIVFILVLIPLMLFFSWLSARFSFIFLELVVQRDIQIKEAFRKYKLLGNSYFKWLIVFGLTSIGGLLLMVALIAFAIAFVKPLLWILVPFLIFLVVALGIVMTLVADFVLPMMYQDGTRVMETLKRFFSLRPSLQDLTVYFLIKLGFGILSGILVALIGLLIGVGAVLIGLVTALIGGFLVSVLSFLKPLFLIVGVPLLIATILAVIVGVGLVTLPIPVFFRAFSLTYLSRMARNYNLLGFFGSDQGPPSSH